MRKKRILVLIFTLLGITAFLIATAFFLRDSNQNEAISNDIETVAGEVQEVNLEQVTVKTPNEEVVTVYANKDNSRPADLTDFSKIEVGDQVFMYAKYKDGQLVVETLRVR